MLGEKKEMSNSQTLGNTKHATNKISLKFVLFSALNKFVFWEYEWKWSTDTQMSLWLCMNIIMSYQWRMYIKYTALYDWTQHRGGKEGALLHKPGGYDLVETRVQMFGFTVV